VVQKSAYHMFRDGEEYHTSDVRTERRHSQLKTKINGECLYEY
jgi:hypothetical protein